MCITRIKKKITFLFIFSLGVLFFLSCSNQVLWEYKISEEGDWDWYTYYDVVKENNTPIIDHNRIYLTYHEASKYESRKYLREGLHVLNKTEGTLEWKSKDYVPPVIVDKNNLFVVKEYFNSYVEGSRLDPNSGLCGLNSKAGEVLWETSGLYLKGILKIKNMIIASGLGYIVAFNAIGGEIKWKINYYLMFGYQMEYDEESDTLLIPFFSSILMVNPDDGTVLKELDIPNVRNLTSQNGFIVAQAGASGKDGLMGIKADTNEIIWAIENVDYSDSTPKPVIRNNICYSVSFANVMAIKIDDGEILWNIDFEELGLRASALPLYFINDKIYWSSYYKNLIYQIDPDSGKFVKKIKLNNIIHSPFAYENGVIYYRSKNSLFAEKVML